MTNNCIWEEEEDGCYEAQCSRKGFYFNDGGPKGNGFAYCPYCGSQLIEKKYTEESEEAGDDD